MAIILMKGTFGKDYTHPLLLMVFEHVYQDGP
jgi:hypothetical protein